MKTLYLDIFSGISGDMFAGAMLDLGVPFDALVRELEKLDLGEVHVHATRKHKSSIEGVKFDVHAHDHGHEHHHHDDEEHDHHHDHESRARHHGEHEFDYEAEEEHEQDHPHEHDYHHEHEHGHEHDHHQGHEHGRTYLDIRDLILESDLSPWVKEKSIAIFERIARAEGKIHGRPAEEVHFHEVGAVDSIVDIVGAAVCLEYLGKPRVLAAPVIEGTGWIDCAHGRFPIPAPATLAILAERQVPIAQCAEPHELVTPTGAAILAEFVEQFGPMQLKPEKVAYGLGQRDNKTRPNVLRVVLGSSAADHSEHDWESDEVVVLETNLDDINSEILGFVVEKAFAGGALDVFHTPIQMKKNRPGVLLTILCHGADDDRFTELLLRETTAFGVRRYRAARRKLKRSVKSVSTAFGEIEVKIGTLDGKTIQASPEYESCKRAAAERGASLKAVYEAAASAAQAQFNK